MPLRSLEFGVVSGVGGAAEHRTPQSPQQADFFEDERLFSCAKKGKLSEEHSEAHCC